MIFTSTPVNQNPRLKSFSAPFYALFDLKLEQPVFGANYIKGKVRHEDHASGNSPPFAFKLKFNKGGAIEFGQAMSQAAKQADSVARETHWQPPPPYTASPAEQYYQAAGNVYQPAYPVGFALPTQVFNQAPPAGFIYAMDAPPPYPGITTAVSQQQQMFGQPSQAMFGQPSQAMYGQQFQQPIQQQQEPQMYPTQGGVYHHQAAPPAPGMIVNGQQPASNPFYPSASNGAPSAPSAPSFDQPPSYTDATKKLQ